MAPRWIKEIRIFFENLATTNRNRYANNYDDENEFNNQQNDGNGSDHLTFHKTRRRYKSLSFRSHRRHKIRQTDNEINNSNNQTNQGAFEIIDARNNLRKTGNWNDFHEIETSHQMNKQNPITLLENELQQEKENAAKQNNAGGVKEKIDLFEEKHRMSSLEHQPHHVKRSKSLFRIFHFKSTRKSNHPLQQQPQQQQLYDAETGLEEDLKPSPQNSFPANFVKPLKDIVSLDITANVEDTPIITQSEVVITNKDDAVDDALIKEKHDILQNHDIHRTVNSDQKIDNEIAPNYADSSIDTVFPTSSVQNEICFADNEIEEQEEISPNVNSVNTQSDKPVDQLTCSTKINSPHASISSASVSPSALSPLQDDEQEPQIQKRSSTISRSSSRRASFKRHHSSSKDKANGMSERNSNANEHENEIVSGEAASPEPDQKDVQLRLKKAESRFDKQTRYVSVFDEVPLYQRLNADENATTSNKACHTPLKKLLSNDSANLGANAIYEETEEEDEASPLNAITGKDEDNVGTVIILNGESGGVLRKGRSIDTRQHDDKDDKKAADELTEMSQVRCRDDANGNGGAGGGGDARIIETDRGEESFILEPASHYIENDAHHLNSAGWRDQLAGSGPERIKWVEMEEVRKLNLVRDMTDQEVKLQEAQFEVITTEASYLRSLHVLVSHFYKSPVFDTTNRIGPLPSDVGHPNPLQHDSNAVIVPSTTNNLTRTKSQSELAGNAVALSSLNVAAAGGETSTQPHTLQPQSQTLFEATAISSNDIWPPIITPQQKHHLFSNIFDMVTLSEKFLERLEHRWRNTVVIRDLCDIIIEFYENQDFDPFVKYLQNNSFQSKTLMELNKCDRFRRAISTLLSDPVCCNVPFDSFILLPTQRLFRLKILLEGILKNVPQENIYTKTKENCETALFHIDHLLKESTNKKTLIDQKGRIMQITNEIQFKKMKRFAVGNKPLLIEGDIRVVDSQKTSRKFRKKYNWAGKTLRVHAYVFEDRVFIVKQYKNVEPIQYECEDHCEKKDIEVATNLNSTTQFLTENAKRETPLSITSPNQILLTFKAGSKGSSHFLIHFDDSEVRRKWIAALNKSEDIVTMPDSILALTKSE